MAVTQETRDYFRNLGRTHGRKLAASDNATQGKREGRYSRDHGQ